jgi:hypothetical protein
MGEKAFGISGSLKIKLESHIIKNTKYVDKLFYIQNIYVNIAAPATIATLWRLSQPASHLEP